jgi:flagellin-like hook-associated protein FlgL
MSVDTNFSSQSIDHNLRAYEAQRASRTEDITSNVSLSDEQKTKMQEEAAASVSLKKDDAGVNTQSSNNEIKNNTQSIRGVNAQEKLLDKIQEKVEQSSQEGLSEEEKANIQKDIDNMLKTYDTISKTVGTSRAASTNEVNNVKPTEQSGVTTFESTQAITQSGTANITLKDSNGSDVQVNSVEIDANNMEDSLKKLAEEINKKAEQTGVTASVMFDEKNGSGKVLFSKAGDESVDYELNISSEDETTSIKTEASATFSLSDLQSGSGNLTKEEAQAIGLESFGSTLYDSEIGTSVIGQVINNAKSDINYTQSELADKTKKIQEEATKLLQDLKGSSVKGFDYSKEASNGLFGLSQVSQAGSLLISQANPNQANVLKLLAG